MPLHFQHLHQRKNHQVGIKIRSFFIHERQQIVIKKCVWNRKQSKTAEQTKTEFNTIHNKQTFVD